MSDAFANYQRVRDEVLRMKAAPPSGRTEAAPSEYWSEELSTIDYMSEASPLIVRKLRHHAFHITGLRPYDYREYADRQVHFERRIDALAELAGGRNLLVPESPALGGFGYSIDGRLYNVDTVKFFEVLVGMQRGGILDPFRGGPRRLVCEIGGGWGGFAYQFRTLFPNVTWAIVDFPELFLFSATYLATVFPQARLRFWGEDETTFDRWEDADFIFIPHDRVEALRQATPDLLVNLVSFQEMTTAQVEAYAGLAASAGCPTVYSLNRDRSLYNTEIESVSHILSRHYDLREVRLLGSDYTKAIKKDSAVTLEEAARANRVGEDRYRHLVGTLRTPSPTRERRSEGERAPLVGIGATLHNRAMYLCEALDSLLAQSYPHFRLVLVDDGSTDGTEAIGRAYERRDPRVRYVRFEERRGMVAAWREAFLLSTLDDARYFAWASDHDRWDPYWLETLVAELEGAPEAVMAYPLTQRMDAWGMALPKPARLFETRGMADMFARWRKFSRSDAVAAGDMVYGLIRADAQRRAGIFRAVLCPDRLLLAELTLQGQIRQVPEILWFRRQFATGSVVRQRSSLFASSTSAPGRMTPPWYLHARSLWDTYGRPNGVPGLSKSRIARLVAGYTAAYAVRHYAKTPTQRDLLWVLHRPRWAYKRLKHGMLVVAHAGLVRARRAGITPFIERLCERVTGRSKPWRRAA